MAYGAQEQFAEKLIIFKSKRPGAQGLKHFIQSRRLAARVN
jgi:hypothetical protein